MIIEDYISFETAKLLKEKGFDEHCFCINYPLPEGEHHSIISPNLLNNSMIPFTDEYKFCKYKEDFITIPTLQMAIKWLLKEYNIFICILFLEESNGFGYTIENIVKKEYITTSKNSSYKEPEEACEAAIKYCLENLI